MRRTFHMRLRARPAGTIARALVFAGLVAAAAALVAPSGSGAAGIGVPPKLYDRLAAAEADRAPVCAKRDGGAFSRFVTHAFVIAMVRLTSGQKIYTARSTDPCFAEAGDPAIAAFVAGGDGVVRNVMLAHAHVATFAADGTLVLTMYDADTTAVVYRSIFRFDGSSYAAVRSEAVYVPTGEVKPSSIALHFPYGASATTVAGNVRDQFPDTYSLDAAKGQTMSIVVVRKSGSLAGLEIGSPTVKLQEGRELTWQGVLPESGRYWITVAGADASPATYSMTVTIR